LSRRYVKFNVEELCELVTSLAGNNESKVCKINKMEGGFNKALLVTLDTGIEVVAKIPCSNAGRAVYNTASEAAVLEYGNLSISVHSTSADQFSPNSYKNPRPEGSDVEF